MLSLLEGRKTSIHGYRKKTLMPNVIDFTRIIHVQPNHKGIAHVIVLIPNCRLRAQNFFLRNCKKFRFVSTNCYLSSSICIVRNEDLKVDVDPSFILRNFWKQRIKHHFCSFQWQKYLQGTVLVLLRLHKGVISQDNFLSDFLSKTTQYQTDCMY